MAAARVAWRRAAGCAAVCALAAVVALELAARGAPEEEPAALAGGAWPPRVVAGSMLAGWGSRLPGVSRLARAHVHEFGTHKFHDGDGLWQSEHDRRGPWFYEVTPADRAKLREVNIDANPLDALPLREMAEAIDDPFDDEQPQSNYFEGDNLVADADQEVPVDVEDDGQPAEVELEPAPDA
eukprot:Tamp_23916.p3 GENE.Tamp_23916~~Tamp_23916.p3  ORF type:complete len:182 (+),score=52.72 Tamp_23916:2-547(+)